MDLKLTTDGDLDISGLKLSWIDGIDAIAQHIMIRLKFFFAEWFLDTTMGMPYKDYILIKGADMDIVSSLFKNCILGTPGVITPLKDFNLTLDDTTRSLKVTFTAETEQGTLSIEDQVIGVLV